MRRKYSKTMILSDAPIGMTIIFGGRKFTILDKPENGILVLDDDIVTKMPFRHQDNKDGSKVAPNYFGDSDVAEYLNTEYIKLLMDNGVSLSDIKDTETDLKCTLGFADYGTCTTKATALTLEQYAKYMNIIPNVWYSYWLATPFENTKHFKRSNRSYCVWEVYHGEYHKTDCTHKGGVRPALTLDPSLQCPVEWWEDIPETAEDFLKTDRPNEMMTLDERDRILEEYWEELEHVKITTTNLIDEPFLGFTANTSLEDIWSWFDKRHSKGLDYLVKISTSSAAGSDEKEASSDEQES